MKFYKSLLFFVLLVLISGTFTFSRMSLGVELEVRYILIFTLLFGFLIHKVRVGSTEKMQTVPRTLTNFMLWNYLFVIFLFVSAFYSQDKAASLTGILDFMIIALLMLLSLYAITNDSSKSALEYVLFGMMFVGIVTMIPVIFSVLQGNLRGESFFGPNVATRILFFSTCCSFYFWYAHKKTVYFLLCLMFLSGVILVGSRGGVVGAFSTIAILYVIQLFSNLKSIRFVINAKKMFAFLVGLGVMYIFKDPILRVIDKRIIGTTFRDNGEIYTAGRDQIYSNTIEMIKAQPLWGYGINSYSYHLDYGYPHNLLLELLFNIGVLGGVYFAILLIYSLKLIIQYRNTHLYIISGIPLYMIIVQMFSGGLYDFRYYYFWMVLLIYYHATGKVEKVIPSHKNSKKKNSREKKRSLKLQDHTVQ